MATHRTWDRLAVGEVLYSPTRPVTAEVRRALVELGGYTHPLFTDHGTTPGPDDRTGPVPAGALPGQALLLLAGGLVEQTGAFDASVLALVGLDEVRFLTAATVGTRIRVRVRVRAKEPTPGGRHGLLVLEWTVTDDARPPTVLAGATARMLCRVD